MERLKYIVEDSTIAELLGVQNFTNKESAILELVKILDDFLNEENLPTGTRIEISALRDRWTEKSIRNLIDYLSITCNDNRMNIKVFPDYGKKVSYIFKRPQLGENFVTLIALFSMKLRRKSFHLEAFLLTVLWRTLRLIGCETTPLC